MKSQHHRYLLSLQRLRRKVNKIRTGETAGANLVLWEVLDLIDNVVKKYRRRKA